MYAGLDKKRCRSEAKFNLTVASSKRNPAPMASIRCAILLLNIEVFIGLLFINLVFLTESFCFSVFVIYQEFF